MTDVRTQSSTTNKVLGYPLNVWYVAAWDKEVTRKPMSRKVAGRPLALYRTEGGKAVALADACWHRLAPLSMGKTLAKDQIQCPYHGIVYNSAGRCVSMPAQETINPSATVPSFPVVERHRYVWVWLGDPTKADPDWFRTCTSWTPRNGQEMAKPSTPRATSSWCWTTSWT
ncbi:putative toluene-4-sulfonate monooxygenase system iron-sulfur subunit TsaM2 [Arthrobacter sp. Hiyo8]|nr:putative toluene-4-sulfonate monooxygenase system iron-sulfur subunit TsaM2 [Arthrobacter sp. Hiyo8]